MVGPPVNTTESLGYRASQAIFGLRNLKLVLGILQAAHVMALEGKTRATAGEIANRANQDFKVSTTPSDVGKFLREAGISVAITHGKARLVLDADDIAILKDRVIKACEQKTAQLEAVLKGFEGLSSRIKAAEDQWNLVVQLRNRERQLAQQLEQERKTPSKLPALEQEAARIRKEAERADLLRKECDEMAKKVQTLPMLEGKKVALNNAIKRYQDEEEQIKAGEARLSAVLQDLKMRSAWVTFVDLDRNIQRQKSELSQLTAQINERRTLLQKILGTNKVS
jgi:hypothetical protein